MFFIGGFHHFVAFVLNQVKTIYKTRWKSPGWECENEKGEIVFIEKRAGLLFLSAGFLLSSFASSAGAAPAAAAGAASSAGFSSAISLFAKTTSLLARFTVSFEMSLIFSEVLPGILIAARLMASLRVFKSLA